MTEVWYCTREDVKSALDIKETARVNAQVDRLIAASSRSIEGSTHRKFYPEVGTRYFDYPDFESRTTSDRLWLDEDELINVTALNSGGVSLVASDYYLEPANVGPPFTSVDINRASSGSFDSGLSEQRSLAITGTYGYTDADVESGALDRAINASVTLLNVTDSSTVGVGSILRIGTERLQVTRKFMLDTTQTLQGNLTNQANGTLVPVVTGTDFFPDEVILIGSERMRIEDVAGNNLIVKRAWDGSVLAAHTTADPVYVARQCKVIRGALGTTAASHTDGDPLNTFVVPSMIRELCIAETLTALLQENSGYGRVVGSGENQREASGKGLADLRAQVYRTYGRKVRAGVV